MGKSNSLNRGFGGRGWVMIISMALTYFTGIATFNLVNITTPYLQSTYGWSSTTIQSVVSISIVFSVVAQAFGGAFLTKKSAKKLAIFCAALYAVALVLLSFNNQFWQFIVAFIIMKVTSDVWMFMANGQLVANWFPRKRAVIMGITTFGIPLGAGIGMFLGVIAISKGSLSLTYLPYVIITIISIVLIILFITDHPEQVNCYPDNDKSNPEELHQKLAKEIEAMKKNPWTWKRIATTKETWFFLIPCGILLLGSGGVMTQIVSILSAADANFFEAYGIYVLLGISVVACIGSYICGLVDEKWGTRLALILSSVTMFIAGLFIVIGGLVLTLIALAFLCIFMGGASNYVVSGCALYWRRDGFIKAFKVIQPIASLIAAVGPFSLAFIAGLSGGSYRNSFIFIMVLSLVSFVLSILINKDNIERKEKGFLTKV